MRDIVFATLKLYLDMDFSDILFKFYLDSSSQHNLVEFLRGVYEHKVYFTVSYI